MDNEIENIDLSNVDLSQYISQTGETATAYIIPNGELGNNLGFDIEFIMPNDSNDNLQLYGQINSWASEVEGNTWTNIKPNLLNDNTSAIVVNLEPPKGSISGIGSRLEYADKNMQALSIIGEITGNKEAKVVGSSNGSIYACDIGAASATNDYGVEVTEVVWSDYGNEYNINLDEQFNQMADGGVSFVTITDTSINENMGAGKILNASNNAGVKSKGYFFGGAGDHDPTCEQAALAYFGIEIKRKFAQYGEYIDGELVRVPYDFSVVRGDDVISVDYRFVNSSINDIKSIINNSSITSKNNVGLPTSGSFALSAVNTVFNDYANTSVELLNSLGITCGNIITMAESLNNIDASLSAQLLSDGGLSLDETSLTEISEFYKNVPTFDMLSGYQDENGTLVIDKDEIFSIMSDSNVVLSSLITDIEDTQRLKQELDGFISDSSSNLTGPAWDKMRSKVAEYSQLCHLKMQYADNMITSIKESMQRFLDYMGEFDCLDMSQIEEIKQGIDSMTEQIETLKALIASTPDFEPIYGIDEEGKTVQIGLRDNTALKASWENTMNVCIGIREHLKNNLEKLEGLPAIDSEIASDIIDDNNNSLDIPTTPVLDSTSITDNTQAEHIEDANYLDEPTVTDEASTLTEPIAESSQTDTAPPIEQNNTDYSGQTDTATPIEQNNTDYSEEINE